MYQQVGQRFSRISWILIGVLLITGPINLFLRVPPSDALILSFLSTGYGQAILMKTSLFVAIIVLSAVHDFWIGPKAHRILASAL